MNDPDILLLFLQEIAYILRRDAEKWYHGYYIEYSDNCGIYAIRYTSIIRIMDHDWETVYEFNLADPDVSPEIVAAKVEEIAGIQSSEDQNE